MTGRRGNPPKLSYDDLVLIRQLYAIGRTDFSGKRLEIKQLADKFEVSGETIRRAVKMDAVELEKRRGVMTRRV